MSGVILAGGRGSRLGGRDKGLYEYRARPLIASVIEVLAPQVDELLINANRNRELYARFGYPVIADGLAGFQGPLAGMLAGLAHARHELVVFAPCDMPALPGDLVRRLLRCLRRPGSRACYVHDGRHGHPVCAALRREVQPMLAAFLAGGQRRTRDWLQSIGATAVDFSDTPAAFVNINTPADGGR